jgi:hypothetical protein
MKPLNVLWILAEALMAWELFLLPFTGLTKAQAAPATSLGKPKFAPNPKVTIIS